MGTTQPTTRSLNEEGGSRKKWGDRGKLDGKAQNRENGVLFTEKEKFVGYNTHLYLYESTLQGSTRNKVVT